MEPDHHPLADPDRLSALAATGLIDLPATEPMQRVSRLVSYLLQAPVALASFVDDRRQFFVAATGFSVEPFASDRQTPLSHSFCQHVVLRGQPLLVNDARREDWLADNRAIDELGVIAYLGVPLYAPGGEVLGSLCAIDQEPRTWTERDENALRDLGDLVGDELVLRQTMTENERLTTRLQQETLHDELTGLLNRRAWRDRAPMELARASREARPASAIMFDIDGFKATNDELGHASGDEILRMLGTTWQPLIRPPDILVRWGGDEFAMLVVDANMSQARDIAQRLTVALSATASMSAGIAEWNGHEPAEDLLGRADAELMTAKRRKRGGAA